MTHIVHPPRKLKQDAVLDVINQVMYSLSVDSQIHVKSSTGYWSFPIPGRLPPRVNGIPDAVVRDINKVLDAEGVP